MKVHLQPAAHRSEPQPGDNACVCIMNTGTAQSCILGNQIVLLLSLGKLGTSPCTYLVALLEQYAPLTQTEEISDTCVLPKIAFSCRASPPAEENLKSPS